LLNVVTFHISNGAIFANSSVPASILTSLGILLCLLALSSFAETPDESPHWRKSACSTCHDDPMPTDATDVRLSDYNELCMDCHDESASSTCPHPTNLPTEDLGETVLPESYRSALADNTIVCTSCHSVQLQCTGGRLEQYQNPAFLRNGPFRPSEQACFDCHDKNHYKKLDPHQPVVSGQTQVCLFCHADVPDVETEPNLQYRLRGNLQCTGCHKVAPHPLAMAPDVKSDEWTHFVVPTPDTANRMQATEDRTGIVLPLDPDSGAINCTTCHNAHPPDLHQYPLRSEDGAEDKLRMLDICTACHDK